MPNSINSTSPSIRDFLLNRNLILADSIADNGLSGVAVGLGQVSQIETTPVAVQPSDNIEVSSIDYRDNQIKKNNFSSSEDYTLTNITTKSNGNTLLPNTPSVEYGNYIGSNIDNSLFNNYSNDSRKKQIIKNQYISTDDMVSATIINNKFSYSQIDGGYLDNNNNINLGGPSTQPYDVVGAILTQNGFGVESNGLTPQFDIRNSLAGRVLGGIGVINDTPLGIIAGKEMLLALGKKAAFNTEKEILGKVNLQPFSLLRGANFINPDWSITVKGSLGGKIFDSALNLMGFELPKPILDNGATIFQEDSGFISDSTLRNDVLINNTGKGQLIRLFDLLNRNTYKPNYKTSNDSKIGIKDSKIYSKEINSLGLSELNNNGTEFIWGQEKELLTSDDSLLGKTKQLFNNKPKLLASLFNKQGIKDTEHSEITTPNGGRLSKGSGVLSSEYIKNKSTDNVFCRTWTSSDRYDNISSLQKNEGLIKYRDRIREGIEDSVLGTNGFPKITPYKFKTPIGKRDDIQKYMFSIENLAWNDKLTFLPSNEIGNGDLVTGTKGRVMWFPPYGIKFTDTTAVNWDKTNFIGRGEPIYTYNNSERSGTLNFQIIIDYPDYMNNTNINTDDILTSIAAGCSDYNDFFSVNELNDIKNEINTGVNVNKVYDSGQINLDPIRIYFPNDSASILPGYEIGVNPPIITVTYSEGYTSVAGTAYVNNTDLGLNTPWATDTNFILDLKKKLSTIANAYEIQIIGYASKDGTDSANKKLSIARANTVKSWVLNNLGDSKDPNFTNRIKLVIGGGAIGSINGTVDSKEKKEARYAEIKFIYSPKINEQIKPVADIKTEPTKSAKELVIDIKKRFHREDKYFKELVKSDVESDKIIYKNIKDKIGFFQPAFHSITPEGFNSRLTFLQQCTRQGPTNSKNGAQNLSFGAPPVCILRIGDFYHTKIIINSLDISYDPLLWDLNPEGVGVQPRIANIGINFKFIGGSSLKGPIDRLQNAVSFNYFANTGVYDPRADKLTKTNSKGNKLTNYDVSDGVAITPEYIDSLSVTPIDKPIINQNNVNEIELKKPISPIITTTPKITAFNTVDIIDYNYVQDPLILKTPFITLKVKLKSENITGSENDAFYIDLSNKNLKISLVDYKTSKVYKSELVLYTSPRINNKDIKDALIDSGYYLGEVNNINTYNGLPIVTDLPIGKYNLILNYNSKRIQTILVEIKLGGFNYSG